MDSDEKHLFETKGSTSTYENLQRVVNSRNFAREELMETKAECMSNEYLQKKLQKIYEMRLESERLGKQIAELEQMQN